MTVDILRCRAVALRAKTIIFKAHLPSRLVPKFPFWAPDRSQRSTMQTRSQGVVLAGDVRYEEVELQGRVHPRIWILGTSRTVTVLNYIEAVVRRTYAPMHPGDDGMDNDTIEPEERAARPGRVRSLCVKTAAMGTVVALCVAAVAGAVGLVNYRTARENYLPVIMLQELYEVMRHYSEGRSHPRFPPPAPDPDVWVPDLRELYPEYLSDPDILVSPLLPNAEQLRRQLRTALEAEPPDWDKAHRIAAQSIVYTGFLFETEADFELFIAAGMPKDNETLNIEGQSLHRARPGVSRLFVLDRGIRQQTASRDEYPIFFMEQPSLRHKRRSKAILATLLDGIVVSVDWGTHFPALDSVAAAFPAPPL